MLRENCCEEHTTMLGILSSCVKGVFNDKSISELNLSDELKIKLAVAMFEQGCLNERTQMINQAKKETTAQIHKFRQQENKG